MVFLKRNIIFDINPNVPYKTCLFDILKGDYDQYVENPMDSNNESFLNHPFPNKKSNHISKSFSNTIDNNLNLQKYYFTKRSINDIKIKDTKKYMNTLQSSTTLSFDKLENFEEIKKRGKLLEFICYNKQKQKNILNNYLKRVENIDSKL